MGSYINPPNMSKEQWLSLNAIRINPKEVIEHNLRDGMLAVCLIDNIGFTAAAILYNISETIAFLKDDSGRPKQFFLAAKEDLLKVSDLKYYIGEY